MSWLDLSKIEEPIGSMIDPGRHMLLATNATVKATRDSTGEYISVKFVVEDGPFSGFSIYHNFNIKNKSEKAQSIGLSQLKSFLVAAGKNGQGLDSVTDINGCRVIGVVKIKKDGDYGDKPVIAYFEKIDDTPNSSSEAPFSF